AGLRGIEERAADASALRQILRQRRVAGLRRAGVQPLPRCRMPLVVPRQDGDHPPRPHRSAGPDRLVRTSTRAASSPAVALARRVETSMGHRYRHFTAATSNDLAIQPTRGGAKRPHRTTAAGEPRRPRKPGHPPQTTNATDTHPDRWIRAEWTSPNVSVQARRSAAELVS